MGTFAKLAYVCGMLFVLGAPAYAEAPKEQPTVQKTFTFEDLRGTWTGGGTVYFSGGNTERMSCRVTYKPSSPTAMKADIVCATESFRIQAEVSLYRKGNALTGRWEEHSFNKSGRISGSVGGTALVVNFNSDGQTDSSLTIHTTGNRQSITMVPVDTPVTSITVGLSRK